MTSSSRVVIVVVGNGVAKTQFEVVVGKGVVRTQFEVVVGNSVVRKQFDRCYKVGGYFKSLFDTPHSFEVFKVLRRFFQKYIGVKVF